MATTTKYDAKKAITDYYLYVPLGAGQLLVEKTKEISVKARDLAEARRKELAKLYDDLAVRGQKLATSIRKSTYTKRAIDQTKTARTQVKAATTSVRKAVGLTAEATKQAAKKVS
jgi:hypothetical protein